MPHFSPALLATLFALLAEATGGSFMLLLAVQRAHMSPVELTIFLTASAATGILVTTLFGHLHDRKPRLWPLFVALGAKVAGYLVCATLTDPWVLIAVGTLLLGPSSASFALLFAMAKGYLDRTGGPVVARGMAALRLASSLGWAIGPAIGAVLVASWSFAGLFFGAALVGVAALLTVLFSRLSVVAADQTERPHLPRSVLFAVAPAVIALTAFHTAMFMGSNGMSVVVASELGREADVGWLFSLCAALEVLVMGVFVIRSPERGSGALLLLGFALFAAYFAVLLFWPTLLSFYLAQILRAAAIGIVSIVGMAHIQGLLPGRAGAASALFGNTMSAGALLSGSLTGTLAGAFWYWSIFTACAALCVAGALLVLVPVPKAR